MLNNKNILITGGTGSFGKHFVRVCTTFYNPNKIIIYSRDEYKQYIMKNEFPELKEKLRFFIGDVRDRDRLYRAFDGVDYVIHAAALKQVPSCEYNPFEAVKTNIMGAQNIIDASIDCGIKKVIALSTDKAVNPINLYGATKLASDKIFISSNAYSGASGCTFSIVRYGNVANSRGSVIPFFKNLKEIGEDILPVTDIRMTRFWITLDEAVDLVLKALSESKGGETYISKIPSFKITDLILAFHAEYTEIGIREGEKLHEVMITEYDSFNTYEYSKHYIIYPNFEWWQLDTHSTPGGKKVEPLFSYTSNNNKEWLSIEQIRERLSNLTII